MMIIRASSILNHKTRDDDASTAGTALKKKKTFVISCIDPLTAKEEGIRLRFMSILEKGVAY